MNRLNDIILAKENKNLEKKKMNLILKQIIETIHIIGDIHQIINFYINLLP